MTMEVNGHLHDLVINVLFKISSCGRFGIWCFIFLSLTIKWCQKQQQYFYVKKKSIKMKANAISFQSTRKSGCNTPDRNLSDYDKWSSQLLPSLPLVVRDLRAMFLPGKQSKIESTQERRVKCDCSLVWLASCRQVEQRAGHFTEVDSLGAERCQAVGEIHGSAGLWKSPATTFKAWASNVCHIRWRFSYFVFYAQVPYLSSFTTNADAFYSSTGAKPTS